MDIRIDLAGDAAAGIAIPFAILLLGWIIAVIARVRIAKRQAEVWGRLVDKLDPARPRKTSCKRRLRECIELRR